MYKSASKLKLRFQITIAILGSFANKVATGSMTVEQFIPPEYCATRDSCSIHIARRKSYQTQLFIHTSRILCH